MGTAVAEDLNSLASTQVLYACLAYSLLEVHFAVFISNHCRVSWQVVVPNWTKNVQFQEALTLASKDTCTHAYTELKIDPTGKEWLRHRLVVPVAQQAASPLHLPRGSVLPWPGF